MAQRRYYWRWDSSEYSLLLRRRRNQEETKLQIHGRIDDLGYRFGSQDRSPIRSSNAFSGLERGKQ